MRTIEIGTKHLNTEFFVSYKSRDQVVVDFWQDPKALDAYMLSDVLTATLEIYVEHDEIVIWNGVVTANTVTFELTETDTDIEWDTRPYSLVFTRAAGRYIILSGEVCVQR